MGSSETVPPTEAPMNQTSQPTGNIFILQLLFPDVLYRDIAGDRLAYLQFPSLRSSLRLALELTQQQRL